MDDSVGIRIYKKNPRKKYERVCEHVIVLDNNNNNDHF